MLVLKTLLRQITLPGWIRYLRRDELSDEIDNCNVALSDCLGSFDVSNKSIMRTLKSHDNDLTPQRSVMLRIIDNIVTRRQSANAPLLLQPAEQEQEQEEPANPQLDQLDITISDLPPSAGMNTNSRSPLEEGPSEEKWTIWKQLIEQDDPSILRPYVIDELHRKIDAETRTDMTDEDAVEVEPTEDDEVEPTAEPADEPSDPHAPPLDDENDARYLDPVDSRRREAERHRGRSFNDDDEGTDT